MDDFNVFCTPPSAFPVPHAYCLAFPSWIHDNCDFWSWLESLEFELVMPSGWDGDGCLFPEKACSTLNNEVITLPIAVAAQTLPAITYSHKDDWCGDAGFDRNFIAKIICADIDPPNLDYRCYLQVFLQVLQFTSLVIDYEWGAFLPLTIDLASLNMTLPSVKADNFGMPICRLDGGVPITIRAAP